MLFEVKNAKEEKKLHDALQDAINQIERKRYLEGINEFETVVSYGIAFYGKKCVLQEYPTDK